MGAAKLQTRSTDTGLKPPVVEIPNKLYFRIGEVSRIAGVPPYVLRFWESEFRGLSPKKSGTGQRLFRRKEVELVLEIKRLLYDHRFTIEGARKALDAKGLNEPLAPPSKADQSQLFDPRAQVIDDMRRELNDLIRMLS